MGSARRERRFVTVAVVGAIFLAALDVTAVAPAMPGIVGSLGGGGLFSWAFSVYMLFSTTTVPVFGRLADRRGRKPVFLAGVGLFAAGSAACAAAQTMPLFLAARALQGLGAGALMPTAFTIVGDLYDLRARPRVQGAISGVWGLASIAGPLAGGALVETVGWRWLFLVNLPIGVAVAVVLALCLREEGYPREGGRIDIAGGTLFSGAVILFLVGLKTTGAASVATLAVGVAAAAAFVRREATAASPMFDLSLFRIPVYRSANLAGLFAGAVLISFSAYVPVFVMNARGGTAVESGLTLMPMSLGWVLAAVAGGRLLIRHDFRRLVAPGLLVLAAATFGVSRIGLATPLPAAAALLFAAGLGFGLSLNTFLVAVQEAVGRERRGEATSGIQFFRQIGGAMGVAALEVLLVARAGGPDLLEARAGRLLAETERAAVAAGFREAMLAAAALAALACVAALLSGGRAGGGPPDQRGASESASSNW